MKKLVLILVSVLLISGCGTPAEVSPPVSEPPTPPAASKPLPEPEPAPEPEPEPEPLPPPPDNSWKVDAPENHGMDRSVLEELHKALAEQKILSCVTAKDGVIIDEYYADGFDKNSVFRLYSCSKSFTGALVGAAIEDGFIESIDDTVYKYLPHRPEFENKLKQKITLRHLLTHTSGLEWYEWGIYQSSHTAFMTAENKLDFILGQRMLAEPGYIFSYSTGGSHLLGAALESAIGMSALDYGYQKLFGPLGMDSVAWMTDRQGVIDGGNGIAMTARDAARFGQLILQKGRWHGEQLLPEEWITESTSVQNEGPGGRTGQYGYQWWVRPFGRGGFDTCYAFGAYGQFIFVVPKLQLVTVITSDTRSDSYAPIPYFTDYVLEAAAEPLV